MGDLDVVKQVPLTMSEVKTQLESIQKKKKELNYRSNRVLEHIQQFKSLKKDEIKAVKEELEGLGISRIKDRQMVKLIDIMPQKEEDIKMALSGENITVKAEDLKKIADVFAKYL